MKNTLLLHTVLVCLLALSSKSATGFTPPNFAATTTTKVAQPNGAGAPSSTTSTTKQLLQPKDVVTKVAVAGATGRTGSLVVQELLNRGVQDVVALVRDEKTAQDSFPNPADNLQIQKCDLNNEREMKKGTTAVFFG